jgi:hypothetical protein
LQSNNSAKPTPKSQKNKRTKQHNQANHGAAWLKKKKKKKKKKKSKSTRKNAIKIYLKNARTASLGPRAERCARHSLRGMREPVVLKLRNNQLVELLRFHLLTNIISNFE